MMVEKTGMPFNFEMVGSGCFLYPISLVLQGLADKEGQN